MHRRCGSFPRLPYLGEHDRLKKLFDFAIEHYVQQARGEGGDPVMRFLRTVTERSARLAASWIAAGFAHGVLNTDNMNIAGESFDYGPYRFVPAYDPNFVAAYFDQTALYAFGKQPRVVLWNLTRLADALRPLSPAAPLGAALRALEPSFFEALPYRVLFRLGLANLDPVLSGAPAACCHSSVPSMRCQREATSAGSRNRIDEPARRMPPSICSGDCHVRR